MDDLNLFSPFLEKYGRNVLLSAVKLVLDPPLIHEEYSKYLSKTRGEKLPPQPKETFLDDRRIISKIKNKDALKVFLKMDELISLLPYTVTQNIKNLLKDQKYGELIETLYLWGNKLDKIRSTFHINLADFHAEDDIKKYILLVMPSKKQLQQVKGYWTEWVWNSNTVTGELAPTWEGWLTDLTRLAVALRSEGIKVIFAIDKVEKEEIIARLGKIYDYITVNMPINKPKVGYVRDQSVTWLKHPIICNMALEIRSGEEHILNEIYWKLNIPPIFRPRWSMINGRVKRAIMEGGNFILIKNNNETALFTGIGVRGSNLAALKSLSNFLPDEITIYAVPLSGYIKNWKETGSVHLDVVMLYSGRVKGLNVMFVDPGRIGFYSILKYHPDKESFTTESLGEIAKRLDITLDEPPRKEASAITMINALNLGNGKLVVDPYNASVNKYLQEKWGLDLIEVPIPQLEAGGGGIRCTTRELFL